jgi:hypothetical protein
MCCQFQNYDGHNGTAGGLGPSDHLNHHHHHGGHTHNLALSLSNKRRSQGGDSKYGFSPPPHHDESPVTSSTIHLNYPPPPHSHQHHGLGPPVTRSPPGHSPPELPPRIDRSNKPSRGGGGTLSRSAAERLFGKGDGGAGDAADSNLDPPNYINATPHHRPPGQTNSSLEHHNMKTVCLAAFMSSTFMPLVSEPLFLRMSAKQTHVRTVSWDVRLCTPLEVDQCSKEDVAFVIRV